MGEHEVQTGITGRACYDTGVGAKAVGILADTGRSHHSRMEPMRPETERQLLAMEAAYERERQQRDLLEKKYARLKRRYVRLERTHARMLLESRGVKRSGTADSPSEHSDAARGADNSPNSQSSSLDVIDLTSPVSRSSAGQSSHGSLSSAVRRLRSAQRDEICAESPNSSADAQEQPEPEAQSREEEEEKEDGEERWRRHRDRLRLLRSSPRHRRHLDFQLPSANSERHTPLSTPMRHEHHPSPYSTHSATSRSSPLPTPSATSRSGGARTHTHTRPRPRLRLQHSPERTAARAYGYELDQRVRSREYAPGRYGTSDRSPAPSMPSPPVATALLSPSPAPRLNAQSDDEASVALARYLQQQENIAAYEEYEARLRETTEREYDQRLLLSSASAVSNAMGYQHQVDPDNMTYEELLQLGEEVGDVKKERWRQVAVHVLSRLPTHRWTRDHGEDIACIICQYNFVPNDRALTLPCAHVFHEECVDGWVRENNSCPLCKREIASV